MRMCDNIYINIFDDKTIRNFIFLFDDNLYVPEIYDETIKTNLSRSINNKLDMIFGIKLSKSNKREDFYTIKKQFIDTF